MVESTSLHDLAKSGNKEALERQLDSSPDQRSRKALNAKDDQGRSALLVAVMNKHHKVVKVLIAEPEIDLLIKDNDGRTPLSLAAQNGFTLVVMALISRPDLPIDYQEDDRRTALSYAAENGHTGVIRLLLERYASGDIEDENGKTPIMYAAANPENSAAQVLLLSKYIHRRIIICCDGTWNDREENQPFTNVTRIQSCFEPRDYRSKKRYEQLSYYLDGIGTGTTWFGSRHDGLTGKSKKIYHNIQFSPQ